MIEQMIGSREKPCDYYIYMIDIDEREKVKKKKTILRNIFIETQHPLSISIDNQDKNTLLIDQVNLNET